MIALLTAFGLAC